MKWVKKLNQLISGANSRTGMGAEQSQWSRTTVKSVEITVETDEMVQVEKVAWVSAVAEPVEGNSHFGARSSRENCAREHAHDLPVD